MQQRVAIARALAYNPAVLLMDEPFAALDALTRDEMQRLVAEVWRETAKNVVYVTHNVAEAVYLADRVIVMSAHPGRVKRDLPIGLARPRDPLSVEFLDFQKRLLHDLGHARTGDEIERRKPTARQIAQGVTRDDIEWRNNTPPHSGSAGGAGLAAAASAGRRRRRWTQIRQGYQTNMWGMPTYYLMRSGLLEKHGIKVRGIRRPVRQSDDAADGGASGRHGYLRRPFLRDRPRQRRPARHRHD